MVGNKVTNIRRRNTGAEGPLLPFAENQIESPSPIDIVRQKIADLNLAWHLVDIDGPAPVYLERGINDLVCRSFGPRALTLEQASSYLSRSEKLSAQLNLSPNVAAVLCAREEDHQKLLEFLNPQWEPYLQAGLRLPGLLEAGKVLLAALEQCQPIADFHDLDCDGKMCGAQFQIVAEAFGSAQVMEREWDRQTQHHGIQPGWVDEAIANGIRLVLVGDMGTGNATQIKRLMDAGIAVIVTDHHEVSSDQISSPTFLLNAWTIKGYDDLKVYAASGIRRFLMEAVLLHAESSANHKSREAGRRVDREHLDLLAGFGQLFDCEQLIHGGRAIVRRAIDIYRETDIPGFVALREEFQAPDPAAQTISINVGSLINCSQRLLSPSDNATEPTSRDARELLTTKSLERARELVARQIPVNEQRKRIEQANTRKAATRIRNLLLTRASPVTKGVAVSDSEFFHGVAGLVASRIRDKTNCTIAVMAARAPKDPELKGSIRSGFGHDASRALADPRLNQLMEGWGAHAPAAGFSILQSNQNAFSLAFPQVVTEVNQGIDRPQHLTCDLALSVGEVSRMEGVLGELRAILEPCGNGNPHPLLLIGSTDQPAALSSVRSMFGVHFALRFKDGDQTLDARKFHEIGRENVFTREEPVPGKYTLVPTSSGFVLAAAPYWSHPYGDTQRPIRLWAALESFAVVSALEPAQQRYQYIRTVFGETSAPPHSISSGPMRAELEHAATLFDRFELDLPGTSREFEERFYAGRHLIRAGSIEPWAHQVAFAAYVLQILRDGVHDQAAPVSLDIEKPTAAGKTLSALLVLGEALSKTSGNCAFLTRNSELCQQVIEEARRLFDLPSDAIAVIDGDTSKSAKKYLISNIPRLLISTVHFFEANKLDPAAFEWITIDEGQNNKGDDPGAKLLRRAALLEPAKRPRIFSMGGSIIGAASSADERAEISGTELPVRVESPTNEKFLRTVIVPASPATRHREKLLYDQGLQIAQSCWEMLSDERFIGALGETRQRLLVRILETAFSVPRRRKIDLEFEHIEPGPPRRVRSLPAKKHLMAVINCVEMHRMLEAGTVAAGDQAFQRRYCRTILTVVKTRKRELAGLLYDLFAAPPAQVGPALQAKGASLRSGSDYYLGLLHGLLRQLDIVHRIWDDLLTHGRARALDYPTRLMWQALRPESRIAEPQRKLKSEHESDEFRDNNRPYARGAASVRALRRSAVREVLMALSFGAPHRSVMNAFYAYYNRIATKPENAVNLTGNGETVLRYEFPEVAKDLDNEASPRTIARVFFRHANSALANSHEPFHDCAPEFFTDLISLSDQKLAIYSASIRMLELLREQIPHRFQGAGRLCPPIFVYTGKQTSSRRSRRENLQSFNDCQNGILLTNQAFCEGHDIESFRQLLILGPFDNFKTKEQLLGRPSRKHGEGSFIVQYLVGGLDEGRKSPSVIRHFAVRSSERKAEKMRAEAPRIVVKPIVQGELF